MRERVRGGENNTLRMYSGYDSRKKIIVIKLRRDSSYFLVIINVKKVSIHYNSVGGSYCYNIPVYLAKKSGNKVL